MFKNKAIKLFLILGMILFSLVGVVGCSNPTGSDNVIATYIEMSYPEDSVDNEFTLVNNHLDLLTLLKNDTPEKFTDSFFETKSLLIFKITEPSGGNKSEIESYEIIDKTLNVYVKTKQYGITEDVGCWVFILELSKDEVNKFDGIRIFKDGEEIMSETTIKTNHLTDEISKYIKTIYVNKINELRAEPLSIDDIQIKNYIGEFNGVHVAIIKGDAPVIAQANTTYYCRIKDKIYQFSFLPEIISVYCDGVYYTLPDACNLNIFDESEIQGIHSVYLEIFNKGE